MGSNSTLHVGTAEQRANLTIGLNAASGAVSGVFDARNAAAVLDLHLNELNVGMGTGTTVGTLRWNQTEVLDANTVTFGRGASAGYGCASGRSLAVGIAGSASNVIADRLQRYNWRYAKAAWTLA